LSISDTGSVVSQAASNSRLLPAGRDLGAATEWHVLKEASKKGHETQVAGGYTSLAQGWKTQEEDGWTGLVRWTETQRLRNLQGLPSVGASSSG